MNRLLRKAPVATLAAIIALIISGVAVAAAASYTLFGDAELVSPGYNSPTAAQLRSVGINYGGVDFDVSSGITFADLEKLSTDYMFTAGTCGGGTPRFQINVIDPNTNETKNIQVYLGDYPGYNTCAVNTWVNSGDLLENGKYVDTSQIGGTFYQSYEDALAAFGSYEVTGIQLVTDGAWSQIGGEQTVRVDNVMINEATTTFESANSCKKGGWEQFATAPGPFKNQGHCVSYFAKGGQ